MGGLTPARLKDHAFISLQPSSRYHLCSICDKTRYEKPHNGVRIDRLPENTVTFPDSVTTNTVALPAFTITTVLVPTFG